MAWVQFTKDFDWKVPGRRVFIAYKAGSVLNVTRACAAEAKKLGVAVDRKEKPENAR